jgi:phospholipid/cholesterol/gamma-HCH transport system substrate-binding protein
MRTKERKNLVKVGAFCTFLVLVGMVFVVSIGKEESLFERKLTLTARVANADKLKPGAVVELKGLRIGHVETIEIISQEMVEIKLIIRAADGVWIKKDSLVAINNAGLVGDKYLEITAGSSESPVLDPEKDVLAGEQALDFTKLAEKGSNIASTAERVLWKVEGLIDGIDAKKINRSIDGITRTSESLAPAMAKLDRAMEKVVGASERLDAVMLRLQKGPGTAHSLIYDDGMHEDLRRLLGGAERNTVIKYFIRESIKKAPVKNKD